MKLENLSIVAELNKVRDRCKDDLKLFLENDAVVYIIGTCIGKDTKYTRCAEVKPEKTDPLHGVVKAAGIIHLEMEMEKIESQLVDLGVTVGED